MKKDFFKGYNRTRLACYSSYFTMSSVFTLPPLLFVTLRDTYGVSYTLLGTLVLANFCTQLIVDMIFAMFSDRFNITRVIRVMPLITALGLAIYALYPPLFPDTAFVGLLVGTIIFSVSAGLSEVLLSPTIAAIPSDKPQSDMSFLHSLYGFGVLFVVIISTLFFTLFGKERWMYLALFFAVLPIISSVLFMLSPIPDMNTSTIEMGKSKDKRRVTGLLFCLGSIFFGSCAENVMSNWASGYIENALHIDKSVGDIFGMAMFAVLLAASRILYARFGKCIFKALMTGMLCSAICYFVVALSPSPAAAVIACALVGFFSAMLWPGALIMMEENVHGVGVAAYALMAASGDLGASVAPQLVGIVVDRISVTSLARSLGTALGMTPEQVGMRCAMLFNSVFPIAGAVLLLFAIRYFKRKKTLQD